ncbi:ABC-three component system middle component 6 [Anaerocolumna chitinilytica]|uniref:Uncharacterized protein n=1 Tax=Anaerocolumna chitinilytica TaxID=1727145 RepID=A0A7I8DEU1_9FIRM|nr:ABC-three component system middle component 6 [Anaerocolumna chitinilytica]BCJ97053.1 hypothetical protein bsdcttw_00940 [Anaerocolumna chitinilytica]
MIINYDSEPKNSLLYTAAIIIDYFKSTKNKIEFERLYNYCADKQMENALFYLSIDWLYLIEVIKEITDDGEVILW